MRLLLLFAASLLSACGARVATRADAPPARVIETPVEFYVPIEPDLRKRCVWKPECKPSEAIACSKERGRCLRFYELNLGGIDRVQGSPLPKAGKP